MGAPANESPFAGCGRLLLLGVAMTVVGTSHALASNEHVGADRCRPCHQAQYDQWKKSGHASALARLSKVEQRDATCRTCHTMAPSDPNPELAGVQCESCHGPGRLYEPDYVMRDKKLSSLLGLKPVDATTCAPCHTGDAPSAGAFTFEEKISLVRHTRPEEPKGE